MKKSLFYYVLAMLCMVSLFTSCSKDDDAPVSTANEVVGEYSGKLNVVISMGGMDIPAGTIDPQAITVTKAGDNAINLSITNFTFNEIPVGNIELKNCTLTANGDKYDFTGTTDIDKAPMLTADVAATGSFSNGTLTLDLDIDAVLGSTNQTVKVTYSGTKQEQK